MLLGATASDVRKVMLEGESGLLKVSSPWCRPRWNPSNNELSWPNGAVARTFSAEKPDQLRGPQSDTFWADELAKMRYPQDAWDQLMFGFRLGEHPQGVVSTTPRPIPVYKELLKDAVPAEKMTAASKAEVVVSRGSTYENLNNLAPTFRKTILKKYEGSRLGRQELNAEILEDVEGAMFTLGRIGELRVDLAPEAGFQRIVIAVDPATTSGEGSDETGILVVGLGWDRHGYVIDDLTGRYSPNEWASIVVAAYRDRKADRVIAETNQGGALVESTLRTVDENISYWGVHAKRGKALRAEPVAALYEQGRVHHIGSLADLENQMCSWVPGTTKDSPDRLDALVYALTELIIDGAGQSTSVEWW